MAVIRVEKNKNYTCMANYHLRDKVLSLKAKGLLSVILSLPDDWKYSMAGLIAICKEGESSVKAAFKELEKAGYVTLTKLYPNQTESGRIEYVYTIHEKPIQEGCEQEVENLGFVPQEVENQGQLNTEEPSTEESSTKEPKKKERRKEGDELLPAVTYDDIVDAYTNEPDIRETVFEFIKMRKLIKAPMTNRALRNMLSKLDRLADSKDAKIRILEQSIENDWKGIFPIRDESEKPKSKSQHLKEEELRRKFAKYSKPPITEEELAQMRLSTGEESPYEDIEF